MVKNPKFCFHIVCVLQCVKKLNAKVDLQVSFLTALF